MLSADGGVGRSTLTAAVGGILAHASPWPTLAVDAASRPFSGLRQRAAVRNPHTVWDAARTPELLGAAHTADQVTQVDPNGLFILAGEEENTPTRRPLSLDELGVALRCTPRAFGAILLDFDPFAAPMLGAVLYASAVLIVARATPESVAHTAQLLTTWQQLTGDAGTAARCVVAVNATGPRVPRALSAHEALLSHTGAPLVRIPHDPALARGPITVTQLRRRTRRSLVILSAALAGAVIPAPTPTPMSPALTPAPEGDDH